MSSGFFSMKEAKQPVNSFLCIALICLLCFWVVLYYFSQRAEAFGTGITAGYDSYLQ